MQFGSCDGPVPWAEGDDVAAYAQELVRYREARPDTFGSTAIPATVRLVPDTAPQAELHLVFDEDRLVRPALAAMVAAAAPEGTVVLHVRDPIERLRAEWLLATEGNKTARVAESPPPDRIWLRDYAGHPAVTSDGPARIDFGYTVDCVIDDAWPATLARTVRVPLWLEGGNLLTDGERCYVSETVAADNALSFDNTAAILATVGCPQTVWLMPMPESIAHIDPFFAVGDARADGRPALVLAQVDAALDAEMHAALEENARRLAPYGELVRVPVGHARPFAPQLNVVPFNGVVLVPDLGGGLDEAGWKALQSAWPTRRLVPIPSAGLATLEGGPHCLTATVPVR